MSNISKTIGYGVGFVLTILIISAAAITLLALAAGYLLPLATAGAVAPGFAQSIAIVATALLARVVVFANSK